MPARPRPSQSPRAEVATRLARQGLANKAIALELGVSEATVSRLLRGWERPLLAQIAQRLARVTGLTAAEREVTGHALAGRTNAEIARLRGRSPRTIANQLGSAYRKLGVGSRRGLRVALERAVRGSGVWKK